MPDETLAREADVFTRVLAGAAPSGRVVEHYVAAHAHLALEPATRMDAALLDFARIGPQATRCADAWCAFFARGSALHRKLTLVAAILECEPPFDALVAAPGGGAAFTLARLAAEGLRFAVALVVGAVVVAGVRVMLVLEPGS